MLKKSINKCIESFTHLSTIYFLVLQSELHNKVITITIKYLAFTLCCRLGSQFCPTLCDPWAVAYQAPLSMGILQAGILEWVAISSPRGSSQPRDWTQVLRITGEFFTIWVTGKPIYSILDNLLVLWIYYLI